MGTDTFSERILVKNVSDATRSGLKKKKKKKKTIFFRYHIIPVSSIRS